MFSAAFILDKADVIGGLWVKSDWHSQLLLVARNGKAIGYTETIRPGISMLSGNETAES